MHADQIIVRDIKPSNLMTNIKLININKDQPLPDLKLYFVDFGLTTSESEINSEIDSEITVGTKPFVHPTVFFSGGIKTHKSNDVYALCLSFFYIES